jgi:hypothetical protein
MKVAIDKIMGIMYEDGEGKKHLICDSCFLEEIYQMDIEKLITEENLEEGSTYLFDKSDDLFMYINPATK